MSTATPLRTPLYGWLAAQSLSYTGTRLSMIAIPWFVLTTTGSAAQTGVVTFAELAPLVVMKALAGPLVDRIGARRVAITADLGSAAALASIPLFHELGLLGFPLLLVLVALVGGLRGPADGAKHSMVPALVEHARVPMERATGLSAAVERTAAMAGAALAGGLIAVAGAANALLVGAVALVGCAAIIALATRRLSPSRAVGEEVMGGADAPAADRTSYLRQLKEGWDFLRHEKLLLGLSLMIAVTNLLDIAYASVLVPVWAKESGGGVAVVGLLFTFSAGGSIVGAVLASTFGSRLPRYRTYLLAFLVSGSPRFFLLAVDPSIEVVLGYAVLAGLASGFLNPVLGAVIFERIPEPLVGRVSSLNTAIAWSLMPLGGVVAGLLVDGYGVATGLVVCGVGYLLATMLPAVQPSWRSMDDRPTRDRVAEPVG